MWIQYKADKEVFIYSFSQMFEGYLNVHFIIYIDES